MDRRVFISGATLGLLTAPLAVEAQQANPYRIGVVFEGVLAVRVNYLPGSLLWLVTTPTQARLMRELHDPDSDVKATIMSLQEARDLLTVVGDAEPATVYEAAAWLLAPPPVVSQSSDEGA